MPKGEGCFSGHRNLIEKEAAELLRQFWSVLAAQSLVLVPVQSPRYHGSEFELGRARVEPGAICVSTGREDPAELIHDLKQARGKRFHPITILSNRLSCNFSRDLPRFLFRHHRFHNVLELVRTLNLVRIIVGSQVKAAAVM